jgi:EAL domain-containing protein (putative c-di-GMP-specific phosphodiesterase class I)
VGRWVLHESCRQAEAWHRRGHRINVSVNVSARQAESDGLVRDVRSALAQSGLEPSALIIEITETTLMRDTEKIIAQLSVLKAIGVRVAIDDFGTGYSSLAYLQQFPVDSLKIDRSFISGMGDNADGSALIHTLVQLGKDLGLETVAEGIEDDLQLSRLQIEDCDTGQGFLFARPLPAEDVEHFLLTFQHPSIPSLPSSTGSV